LENSCRAPTALQRLRSKSSFQENGGTAGLFHYQLGVEEEVPSDGVAAGVSGAGVVTGAGSAAGAGAGAGFGLTARFLTAFLAFFFVAFLAFPFFFANARFTGIMFQLWKPNKASLGADLICRWFCSIHVCTRWPVDRTTERSNWLPKTMSCAPIGRQPLGLVRGEGSSA
jgi:hypothetical protein